MLVSVLRRVFSVTHYISIASVVAFTVFCGAILLPNADLILAVFSSASLSLLVKTGFVFSLFGGLVSNHTIISALYLVTISLFIGVNISLLVYYIKRLKSGLKRNSHIHFSSLGGIVSGFFGIGCAACGSIILTSVLATIGGGGLLAWLPFHGAEFGLVGIILVGASIYLLAKKINDPLVCFE